MIKRITLIFIMLFFLGIGVAFAEIPKIINYQGKVTDAQGAPLTGSYALTFRIYDAESGGNMLWEEAHSGVVVDKGLFNILLGSVAALSIAFDKPYFLEIKVGSEVMSPRQQIASSAYAMRADKADKATQADNAVTVANVGVSVAPAANKILPLDNNSKLPKSVIPNILGTWETKANNTVYEAATDGLVTAWATSGPSGSWVLGYTDGNNPPITVRAHCAGGSSSAGTTLGITMPVRKGDYWKVTGANVVNWISLGS